MRGIFADPRHPYTRALLRSIPTVQAKPRTRLPTIAGSIPHPINRPGGCPYHPRCAERLGEICRTEAPPPRSATIPSPPTPNRSTEPQKASAVLDSTIGLRIGAESM